MKRVPKVWFQNLNSSLIYILPGSKVRNVVECSIEKVLCLALERNFYKYTFVCTFIAKLIKKLNGFFSSS